MPNHEAALASAGATVPHGTPPALQIKALSASYGRRRVLTDVSFSVEQGTITALLGRNGAGKSTTLMSIAGFVHNVSGSVIVDGALLLSKPHQRAKSTLGLVIKGSSIFGSLTLADNLALGGVKVDDVISLFPELAARVSVKAGLLSGGEQQMVTVARAVLRGPRVLMLDELTAGLSPAMSGRIIDVVRQQTIARQMAVIVVEQHVHVAERIADKALIMGDGKIQLRLDQADFRSRVSEIERVYLGRPTE